MANKDLILIKNTIEAAIFVAEKPLSVEDLQQTVLVSFDLSKAQIVKQLNALIEEYQQRGINLIKVASGYRFQSNERLNSHLTNLWQEKAPKYSRALLETLALIAYKQPITRGEIENVRGVSVSSHIIKTLVERNWIHVVGQKEVPGRPALFGTTKMFLDYFALNSLAQLPELTSSTETVNALNAMIQESAGHPTDG